MVLPTKAVTRHIGIMQLMMTPVQPSRHRALASICIPMEAMMLKVEIRSLFTEKCSDLTFLFSGAAFNFSPGLPPLFYLSMRFSFLVLFLVSM